MNCIILAAGKNTRLDNGIPKSMLKIGEETLLERHLRQFVDFGVKRFCIVTGYRHHFLEEFIESLDESIKTRITIAHNPEFDLANGLSLYQAKAWVEENGIDEFFYTMADHFFSEAFVAQAVSSSYADTVLSLVVDRPSSMNDHIDLDDVTRVESNGGFIQAIGKGLASYDYFDTGLFHAKKEMFDYLGKSIKNGKDSISDMVQLLSKLRQTSIEEVSGHFWNDVDTQEDLSFMRDRALNLEIVPDFQ
ncbi:MAG: NTP transferase domain-containing protein [Cytophagales bacterium]|nr:NTP transferase domain-containing protein [Cytophagales bacterium]